MTRGGPLVHLPHVAGMLWAEVVEAVMEAGLVPAAVRLDADDPGAYGSWIRERWRAGHELLVVEQDTVPPVGALRAMASCRRLWCSVEHDLGGHRRSDTLGCVRLSAGLLRAAPELADRALGAAGELEAWDDVLDQAVADSARRARRGGRGRRAVPYTVSAQRGSWPSPTWPTSTPWWSVDVALARALRAEGLEPCVHAGVTRHLGNGRATTDTCREGPRMLEARTRW